MLELLTYSFIQRAFVAGAFVAITCSILGLFLVLRRLSLIGDGLSHVSFGAIAVGLFLGLAPLYVAIPLVILGAILILKISEKAKVYGDAAIGIVSSIALAGGIILASISSGFNVDLFSYLFGNILVISQTETITSIILSAIVLVTIFVLYHDLLFLSFNEELAHTSGVKTKTVNTLLIILTAITVVLSIKIVGVMLVSSFLILPAVTSLQIARSFKNAILIAATSSVVSLLTGVAISFALNIPSGATVVVINFLFFITSWTYSKIT